MLSFFSVVDKALNRVKQAKGFTWLRAQSMAFPVSIQRFQRWRGAPAADGTVVIEDGLPAVEDFLNVAAWDSFLGQLRQWECAPHPTRGRVALAAVDFAKARVWDWQSPSTPALPMLDSLRRSGWAIGPAPLVHTADSPRRFCSSRSDRGQALSQVFAVASGVAAPREIGQLAVGPGGQRLQFAAGQPAPGGGAAGLASTRLQATR